MSMGHSACFADVVEGEFVINTCPVEFEMLLDALTSEGKELSELAQNIQIENNIDSIKIEKAYDKLISSFKKKTRLTLEIAYHDSENDGDIYDDVDGVFWCVSGVWQYTVSGKKYKNLIKRKMYVKYG